jgi:RecA-family ATPase
MMDALTQRGTIDWRAKRDVAERGRRPLGLAPVPDDLSLNEHHQRAGSQPADETQAVAELLAVSAATFSDEPVLPRRWIVLDMIPDRTVSIVAGDGGGGKTTLMLQLAAAIAGDRPWLGCNPEPGTVLFLSAEDELDELHRRIAAIASSLGVALSDLADLHLVALAGKDAVMGAAQGKTGIVTATAVFRGLVALVERLKPRVIFLDALADVFGGDEVARAQARQFISLLRGLAIDHNLAVVLIAHPSLTGITSGSGTSGSTGWSNSVRARLYLDRVLDDRKREMDPDLRVLQVKKSNYGPVGIEKRLRWRDGVFLLDGPATGVDGLAADAKAEQVFLDLLAEFNAQGRDVSANRSPTFAPTRFEKHPRADGLTKKSFEGAMERLLVSKRIGVQTFGSPSRPRSRLVFTPDLEIRN